MGKINYNDLISNKWKIIKMKRLKIAEIQWKYKIHVIVIVCISWMNFKYEWMNHAQIYISNFFPIWDKKAIHPSLFLPLSLSLSLSYIFDMFVESNFSPLVTHRVT